MLGELSYGSKPSLDSNRGPLLSEVNTFPAVPQPLPSSDLASLLLQVLYMLYDNNCCI